MAPVATTQYNFRSGDQQMLLAPVSAVATVGFNQKVPSGDKATRLDVFPGAELTVQNTPFKGDQHTLDHTPT